MKNILIMEDNLSLAMDWRDAFELNGHQVTLCHTGDEAIVNLEEFEFDLVVTDMFVPKGKGGLHVIGKLATMGADAPVTIAVTGARGQSEYPLESTNIFLNQAKRLGSSVCIEKPFPAAELLMLARKLWDDDI
jgi:CheY-like chemotaxis protein